MLNLVDAWHVVVPSRRCPKCEESKPLTEAHWRRWTVKRSQTGFRNPCKACIKLKEQGVTVPSKEDGEVKRDANVWTWTPKSRHVVTVTGPNGHEQKWGRTADKETVLALTVDHYRNAVEKGALMAGPYKFLFDGTKECRTIEIGGGR